MKINSTKSIQAHACEQQVHRQFDAAQALLNTMTQLGDAALAEGGVAHWWPTQLKAVVVRVQRLGSLDTMGQALAMQAYMIGIAIGLYGAKSAIVQGLNTYYQRTGKAYRTPGERSAQRIFDTLMAAGEAEGRERQCQGGFDAALHAGFEGRADMPAPIFSMISARCH